MANVKLPSPGTLNLLLMYQKIWWVFWMLWGQKASTKLLNMLKLFLTMSRLIKRFSTNPFGDLVVKRTQNFLTHHRFSKYNLKQSYLGKEIQWNKIIEVRFTWKPSPSTMKFVLAILEQTAIVINISHGTQCCSQILAARLLENTVFLPSFPFVLQSYNKYCRRIYRMALW